MEITDVKGSEGKIRWFSVWTEAPMRRDEMKSSSDAFRSQKDTGAPNICKNTPTQRMTITDDLAI